MMSREMLVKRPMEKTGDWLFSTKTYTDWFSRINVDSTHGILWLKGKPGSGKSTLMKEAVHRTKNYCHPRPIIATCFFNAQGSELERSPSGLIRSLLMQICRQDERFKNLVVTHYLNAAGSSGIKWNPSLDELQGLLEIGLLEHASKQRFVFFIDALDECGEVHARAITRYFRMLSDSVFTAGKALDVCLSSRHYPTITIPRCPEIAVEEGNGADISSYIQTNIPYGITEHDALVDRLRLLLLQKTSGVFLWIVLVVDMVLQDIDAGKTEEEIEETLREVPVSLAELFKGLLCTLTTKEREGSMILVQWVLLSPTPLQAVDVRTIRLLGTEAATSLPKALAKSQRPGNLSVDWEIDASRVERNVRTLSRGLMEISGIHVRFIHESVREFFLQEGSAVFGLPEFISAGHCMIVRACLYGLCVLENLSAMESSESQIFAWIPFYVSRSILYHAIQARHALKLPNQLFHLLRSITKIVASTCRMRDATALLHTGAIQVVETQKASRISVYRIHKDRLLDYHLFSLLISGVSVCNHIFNQLNILSSLRIKLNSDCILDLLEPDSNGWESEYVDFDDESNLLVDGASRPGLFRSIMKHEERQKDKALTRLLDQGADINISDFEGNTALHLAAWQGMELVTDTLLKYNPTNTYNNYGMTPLGLACLYGHKNIVNKLLIHEGHFFQQLQGQDGGTLLHIAAIAEDSSLADILLRAGASPNLPNEFGRTPLHFAIQYGASSELVKLLLLEKYGGDLYWKDQAGLTPLDVAIDLNQLLQEQNPRQLWSGSSTNFEKTLASRNSHRSWVQAGEGMFAPPASHN
jgi:ankyrin repeat protein